MTSNVKYISAVPAIKTIPGLDEFDYAVKMDASVELGDLIRVPFRKKLMPALIVGIKSSSRFADKAILIESPEYIFRLGKDASILLTACASQSFTSKPTVFLSWLRTVPKKLKVKAKSQPNSQMSIGSRETRFLVDRLHDKNGLIQTARQIKGKTLILCPWQKRAANIANLLSCPILHGEITPTNSWQILDDFINGSQDKIVTTRIGAWLATQVDNCLVDEPENDDYKSDEQTPRLDARWIIEVSAKLKLNLNLIYFSTTPKLSIDQINWNAVKSIEAKVTFEH